MSERFESLVAEAVEAERAYRAHTGGRLSLGAFVSEALEAGDSTPARISALRKKLEDRLDRLRGVRIYLRSVEGVIGAGHAGRPPKSFKGACFAGRDEADQELRVFGGNMFELWAIAAENLAARNPEVFGQVDDAKAYDAATADLKTRRQDLFSRIGKEFDQTDLQIGRITSDGAALITFKLAADQVSVAPQASSGERLVNYLLASV
ncbi:MAG: hypothetical protein ACREVH_01540 [Gammaproteobacteria bacterium]